MHGVWQMECKVPRSQKVAADAISYLDHICALDIDSKTSYIRLSGIICTIGESYAIHYKNAILFLNYCKYT